MAFDRKLVEIHNTRYIWTIAHILDLNNEFESDFNKLKICLLSYNHGMRDSDESGIKLNGPSIKPIKEDIKSFLKEQINLNISEIEDIEPFEYKLHNIKDCDFFRVILKDCTFIIKPREGDESKILTDNYFFYLTGYLYTLNYIKGFFVGLFRKKLRRNKLSGEYYGGIGFDCRFEKCDKDFLSFIMSSKKRIINEEELNFNNILPDNNVITQLVGNGSIKDKFNIWNTRYIWSLNFLTEDNFESRNKEIIRIAFSHGVRDYITYKDEHKNETYKYFLENKGFFKFKADIKIEIDFDINSLGKSYAVFYQLEIIDSIFVTKPPNTTSLWEQTDEKEKKEFNNFKNFEKGRINENKKLNEVGFLYTKHYLRGFFHGTLLEAKEYEPNLYCGDLESNLFCYYQGESSSILHFTICTDKDNSIINEKYNNNNKNNLDFYDDFLNKLLDDNHSINK